MEMTINTIIVAVIIALLPVSYLFGGVFGLEGVIVNMLIMAGLIYWIFFNLNGERMDVATGCVVIGWTVFIIILYSMAGTIWAPVALFVVDLIAFPLLFMTALRTSNLKGHWFGGNQ